MTRNALAAWACLLCLVLAGCAGPGPEMPFRPSREAIRAFSLEGRLSVKYGAESFAGALAWTHIGARDEMIVATPLGQSLAELVGHADGAHLETADKQRYSAPDVETLSERVFGTRLPLRDMPSWIIGAPSVAAVRIDRDAVQRPQRIFEQGWQIEYLAYENERPDALPTLLHFQRGEIEVRLKIDSWSLAQ